MQKTEFIWHNGEIKPWEQAQVHVLTHALHYGSSVFEGIRVYDSDQGPVGFRLSEHIHRMFDSASIYRMPMPWSPEELIRACNDLVLANQLTSAYLRPILFRGTGTLGVVAGPEIATEGAIAAIEWGAYLGEDSRTQGVDVCVSSWRRPAPGTVPTMAKAGGNYLSSQLISMEAKQLGFHEGIALAVDGTLSEGAGENLFLVHQGKLMTPPLAASILGGITRDSVLKLARTMGMEILEQALPREMLYIADELFLTGTAAEITPVRSVDRITVGGGQRGPVTERIQDAFFGLFDGSTVDRWQWLEPVSTEQEAFHGRAAVSV
jgi:branched-chain amino acid aminotransferase